MRAAIESGIAVYPIPGPSAVVAALSASGLPTDAFRFAGFLPHKPGQRMKALEAIAEEHATVIFYEAPHRILESLEAVEQLFGDRPVVVARELTKIHEEFLRGTAAEIRAQLAARDSVKGEITLLIGKATAPPPDDTPLEEAVGALERAGIPRMDAIKQVARRRGLAEARGLRPASQFTETVMPVWLGTPPMVTTIGTVGPGVTVEGITTSICVRPFNRTRRGAAIDDIRGGNSDSANGHAHGDRLRQRKGTAE